MPDRRRGEAPIVRLKFSTNPYSNLAFAAGALLLLAVLFVPGLKQLFLVSPQFGISQLGIITALAVVPTLIIQTIKLIAEKRQSA